MAPRIRDSTFIVSTNGHGDGPAQALRDYLVRQEARTLTVVNHPLVAEASNRHAVITYEAGERTRERTRALPNRPPFTFVLDMIVPPLLPRCDAWFGFNNLACGRGLALRRIGRTKTVYYWAVDFVPERFGPGPISAAYKRLDRHCVRHADARIELSEAALEGRVEYLGLSGREQAPALIAPMGAWLERTPRVSADAWSKRKVVYLGHLVERQGVDRLLDALALLAARGVEVSADIVGSGPLESQLRDAAVGLGLSERVVFHGFVADHRDVESILAGATVAVAPYVMDQTNFSRYADPGKLKAYLGAGLPIVLTPVPPNAAALAQAGAARIVEDSPAALAQGIEALMASEGAWLAASRAASTYAEAFDWNLILGRTLESLGFVS